MSPWNLVRRPEQGASSAFRLFVLILSLVILGSFAVRLIAGFGKSLASGAVGLAALLGSSAAAYFIRENGKRRRDRERRYRGAERTPVLPHQEEDL